MAMKRHLQALLYFLTFWTREVLAARSQLFWPVSPAFGGTLSVRLSPRKHATLVQYGGDPSKQSGLSNIAQSSGKKTPCSPQCRLSNPPKLHLQFLEGA